ncbi:unnamed protein product [Brassica rapa subsp. trilocularis]
MAEEIHSGGCSPFARAPHENDHPSVRDSSWMVWQIVLCLLLQVPFTFPLVFEVRRLRWYAFSSLIPLGLALNVSVESKLEAIIRD